MVGWEPFSKLSGTSTEQHPKRSYYSEVIITAFQGLYGSTGFLPKSNFLFLFQPPSWRRSRSMSVLSSACLSWENWKRNKRFCLFMSTMACFSFSEVQKNSRVAHVHMESILKVFNGKVLKQTIGSHLTKPFCHMYWNEHLLSLCEPRQQTAISFNWKQTKKALHQ